MGELLGLFIMVVGLGITFYTTTSVAIGNHELRLTVQEKMRETEAQNIRLDKTESKVEAKEAQLKSDARADKLDAKMDQVITAVNQLSIEIQNKADKK